MELGHARRVLNVRVRGQLGRSARLGTWGVLLGRRTTDESYLQRTTVEHLLACAPQSPSRDPRPTTRMRATLCAVPVELVALNYVRVQRSRHCMDMMTVSLNEARHLPTLYLPYPSRRRQDPGKRAREHQCEHGPRTTAHARFRLSEFVPDRRRRTSLCVKTQLARRAS